jgi:hypothetical protein
MDIFARLTGKPYLTVRCSVWPAGERPDCSRQKRGRRRSRFWDLGKQAYEPPTMASGWLRSVRRVGTAASRLLV